jgi:hypothetical protein
MAERYNPKWRKDWRSTSPIRYKTVKITSAEILALNATPKELVAAPGAGRAIEFVSAVLHLDYGTTTYTANGTLTVRTATSNSVLSGVLAAAELLHSTADKVATMVPASTGIGLDINEAIELFEPTGECTTGNGTLTIVVGYRIHSFITY